VDVVPSPTRTVDGYTLEEMELRVKRAKIVSIVPAIVGGIMVGAANAQCLLGEWTESCNRLENAGIAVMSAGGAAMIATGALLGVRKRKLRRGRAHYGRPHRVQWDLAQSRLVF